MARPFIVARLARADLKDENRLFHSFRGVIIFPSGIPITTCGSSEVYDMRGNRLNTANYFLRMAVIKYMSLDTDYVLIEWTHYGYRIIL